jgi:hypothetical protein
VTQVDWVRERRPDDPTLGEAAASAERSRPGQAVRG